MAQTALSPHALHVHPLLPVGSTRTVWTRGSPIHSNESVVATVGGTVEPLIAVPQVPQDMTKVMNLMSHRVLFSTAHVP